MLTLSQPMVGRWDPVRLEQIVMNLLSNAAKYGNGQPIEIRLREDGRSACLTVKDHGIGIAESEWPRNLRKFERAVPATRYGGFGVGLFVVQQLVLAMRGAVSVLSRPGAGAEFTVRLPRAPA